MDKIYALAEKENAEIIERKMTGNNKGFYADNIMMLDTKMSRKSRKGKAFEEFGHHFTSTGDIIDLKNKNNAKQEYKARAWGFEHHVPISDLVQCLLKAGNDIDYFLELLDIEPEDFFYVIQHYISKYGNYYKFDNYTVIFNPLKIVDLKMEEDGQ